MAVWVACSDTINELRFLEWLQKGTYGAVFFDVYRYVLVGMRQCLVLSVGIVTTACSSLRMWFVHDFPCTFAAAPSTH